MSPSFFQSWCCCSVKRLFCREPGLSPLFVFLLQAAMAPLETPDLPNPFLSFSGSWIKNWVWPFPEVGGIPNKILQGVDNRFEALHLIHLTPRMPEPLPCWNTNHNEASHLGELRFRVSCRPQWALPAPREVCLKQNKTTFWIAYALESCVRGQCNNRVEQLVSSAINITTCYLALFIDI